MKRFFDELQNTNRMLTGLTCLGGLGVVLGLAYLWWGMPWFPRRSEPILNSATIRWQGGTVGIWDYASFPGGFDNEIEWIGPHGDRKLLADIGNTHGEIQVLPDGRLEVGFVDERTIGSDRPKNVTLRWTDLATPPTREEWYD